MGNTNSDGLFLLHADWLDCTCGTNLAACGALGAAVTVFITHVRLHEMLQI